MKLGHCEERSRVWRERGEYVSKFDAGSGERR